MSGFSVTKFRVPKLQVSAQTIWRFNVYHFSQYLERVYFRDDVSGLKKKANFQIFKFGILPQKVVIF